MNTQMTPHQFGLFRFLLGAYCAIHLLGLLPHGVELFSNQGMLPDPSLLPTWEVPNIFWLSDSPAMVLGVLWVGIGASIAMALGLQRRWMGLLLWVVWMSLFNRNFLISNPSLPFVGLLLLLMAAIPRGESFSLAKLRREWEVPPAAIRGFFFLLMAGYTVSGLHKMGSISWMNGSAISHILALPLARDNALHEWILSAPDGILMAMTWGSLAMEILALPLLLISSARKWIWLGLLSMQVGILTLVDFADLTGGMLLAHLFVFDRNWMPAKAFATQTPIVFFDGVCGLCNRAVDFILVEDPDSRFRFAPVQGEKAASIDDPAVRSGASMALQDGDTLYTKSDAVLRIAAGLGGIWRVFSWLSVLPRPLRDGVYFGVQKCRYTVFGKRETCRLPSQEERSRFYP
jgi:predicted DCC family thiol-disulfide oxidoreductase YuxK